MDEDGFAATLLATFAVTVLKVASARHPGSHALAGHSCVIEEVLGRFLSLLR